MKQKKKKKKRKERRKERTNTDLGRAAAIKEANRPAKEKPKIEKKREARLTHVLVFLRFAGIGRLSFNMSPFNVRSATSPRKNHNPSLQRRYVRLFSPI